MTLLGRTLCPVLRNCGLNVYGEAAPRIHLLCMRWWWAVSLPIWQPQSRGRPPATHWTDGWVRHRQCELFRDYRSINSLPGVIPYFLRHAEYGLGFIPSELPWAEYNLLLIVYRNVERESKSVRHLCSIIHGVLVPHFDTPAGSVIEGGTCGRPIRSIMWRPQPSFCGVSYNFRLFLR